MEPKPSHIDIHLSSMTPEKAANLLEKLTQSDAFSAAESLAPATPEDRNLVISSTPDAHVVYVRTTGKSE